MRLQNRITVNRKPVAFFTLLILILSCQMKSFNYNSVVIKDSGSIIKSYSLKWIYSDESNKKYVIDTLKIFLHLSSLDTAQYPSWYPSPTRLHFKLLKGNRISFKFSFVEDYYITTTNSVHDTLNKGDYYLTLNSTNLKSGLYLFHSQVGDSMTTQKFVLFLNR